MDDIHCIIFLPGLGDKVDHGQIRALKRWQRPGVVVDYHKIGWSDKAGLGQKLEAVLSEIDTLTAEGNAVSLVGVSAGSSLALIAFEARKDTVKGLVLISGKLHSPWTVNQTYYRENPALKKSFEHSHQIYQRLSAKEKERILTTHGMYDHTVPPEASVISGVRNKVILGFGHMMSIAMCLLFYGKYIVNFLESRIKT